MKNEIREYLESTLKVKNSLINNGQLFKNLEAFIECAIQALKNNKRIFTAGNGGSAADAQHIAAEFVGRFNFNRNPLPSIALTTNSSILTAVGNDYGFETIFSRQLSALGNKGDLLIALSTSGNSPNILKVLEECQKLGIISLGLTGKSGGKMETLCDYIIKVPSEVTSIIQECHLMLAHAICLLIEKNIFSFQK